MKKFLAFCLVTITVVALGYMSYYFLIDREMCEIISSSVYYVNPGDKFTITLERKNPKSDTVLEQLSYNTGIFTHTDEDVEVKGNYLSYTFTVKKEFSFTGDENSKNEVNQEAISFKFSNENIYDKNITVYIGNGKIETPYFINNKEDLLKINNNKSSYYKLVADINMNGEEWVPLCSDSAFLGRLNGQGHTISNFKVTGNQTYAGLFAKIGSDESTCAVENLSLSNVEINGNFDYAGTLCGVNNGIINGINVYNTKIINSKENSNTGGLVGANIYNSFIPTVDHMSVGGTVKGNGTVGGIVGLNEGGYVYNCFTKENTDVIGLSANSYVGGLVGSLNYKVVENNKVISSILNDSYSLSKVSGENTSSLGVIIGNYEYNSDYKETNNNIETIVTNYVVGCYYNKEVNTNINAISGKEDSNPNEIAGVDESNKGNLVAVGIHGAYGLTKNELKTEEVFTSFKSMVDFKEEVIKWSDNVWSFASGLYPAFAKNYRSTIKKENFVTPIILTIEKNEDGSNFFNKLSKDAVQYIYNDIDLSDKDGNPYNLSTDANWKKLELSGQLIGVQKEDGTYPVISGFTFNSNEESEKIVGFFKKILSNGCVKNLVFDTIDLQYTNNIGSSGLCVNNLGIVAGINLGTIENVTVQNSKVGIKAISNENVYVGGLVGLNNGVINNCSLVNSSIRYDHDDNFSKLLCVGGIAGGSQGENAVISNSYVLTYSYIDGKIEKNDNFTIKYYGEGKDNKEHNVGGIVGYISGGATLEHSYNSNYNVIGTHTLNLSEDKEFNKKDKSSIKNLLNGAYFGGLVGRVNGGSVISCYSNANVEGVVAGAAIGKIEGDNNKGLLKTSFVEGTITSSRAAGLVGYIKGNVDILNNRTDATLVTVKANPLSYYNENGPVHWSTFYIRNVDIDVAYSNMGGIACVTANTVKEYNINIKNNLVNVKTTNKGFTLLTIGNERMKNYTEYSFYLPFRFTNFVDFRKGYLLREQFTQTNNVVLLNGQEDYSYDYYIYVGYALKKYFGLFERYINFHECKTFFEESNFDLTYEVAKDEKGNITVSEETIASNYEKIVEYMEKNFNGVWLTDSNPIEDSELGIKINYPVPGNPSNTTDTYAYETYVNMKEMIKALQDALQEAESGTTEGGSTESGSTESGTTNGSTTENGSTESGSTNGGATNGGTTENGSIESGNTEAGSTENGATPSSVVTY